MITRHIRALCSLLSQYLIDGCVAVWNETAALIRKTAKAAHISVLELMLHFGKNLLTNNKQLCLNLRSRETTLPLFAFPGFV